MGLNLVHHKYLKLISLAFLNEKQMEKYLLNSIYYFATLCPTEHSPPDKLTHSVQEVVVEAKGKEGLRQLSEPAFHQTCHRVDGVFLKSCPLWV